MYVSSVYNYARSRFKSKSVHIRIKIFRLLRRADKLASSLTRESELGYQLYNFEVKTRLVFMEKNVLLENIALFAYPDADYPDADPD